MNFIITTLASMLPGILLNMIKPFLSEKMLTEIAEKVTGKLLKKIASLTDTDEDDKAVQFIIDTWKKDNN